MQEITKKILKYCLLLILMWLVLPKSVSAIQTTTSPVFLALQADSKTTLTSTTENNIDQTDNDNDEDEEASETLDEPIVPTKFQWLILSGIALLVGLISYLLKAHQLTTEGELNIYPITKTFSIPLHKPIYKFMLFLTASMALIGFAICLSIYNSVFMPDIVGVSIAGPIFAYLIHLLYLMEKGRKGDD